MKHSDAIAEISKALSAAQGEFQNIACNKVNTYYDSKYADLGQLWDMARPILSKHGLAVIQTPQANLQSKTVEIHTVLTHISGEYFASSLDLPAIAKAKDGNLRFDAQTIGIAITYGRRYALASMLGLASEEDVDGQGLGVPPDPPPVDKGKKNSQGKSTMGADKVKQAEAERRKKLMEELEADILKSDLWDTDDVAAIRKAAKEKKTLKGLVDLIKRSRGELQSRKKTKDALSAEAQAGPTIEAPTEEETKDKDLI